MADSKESKKLQNRTCTGYNSKLVIIKFWYKTLKRIEILQLMVCKTKINEDFLSKVFSKKYTANHNLWSLKNLETQCRYYMKFNYRQIITFNNELVTTKFQRREIWTNRHQLLLQIRYLHPLSNSHYFHTVHIYICLHM